MKNVYITSLFLLSATVFVGGCALTQKSNPVLTPTVSSTGEGVEGMAVSSTADEVDTSTWKTYRNEELGFEIALPSEWAVNEKRKNDEWSFGTTDVSVDFRIEKTTSTLEEVRDARASEYMAFQFNGMEKIRLLELDGYRNSSFYEPSAFTDGYFYNDTILLMSEGAYVEIDFFSSSGSDEDRGEISLDSKKWEAALKTLKRI